MAERIRPIKIDLSDGPCPHCEDWAKWKRRDDGTRACDECGNQIPVLPGMGGAGYESQLPHHWHMDSLDSRSIWMPVMMELCPDCYRKNWSMRYPSVPCQI